MRPGPVNANIHVHVFLRQYTALFQDPGDQRSKPSRRPSRTSSFLPTVYTKHTLSRGVAGGDGKGRGVEAKNRRGVLVGCGRPLVTGQAAVRALDHLAEHPLRVELGQQSLHGTPVA